jgi:dolichyl-phosphate-mannose--protein O-mannosyl transferase
MGLLEHKNAAAESVKYTMMIMGVVLILLLVVLYYLGEDLTQIRIQNLLLGIVVVSAILMVLIYREIRKLGVEMSA